MLRRTVAVSMIPALLGGCYTFGHLPPEHRRAIVLSLDAGGQEVIDHFIDDGAMPNLVKLRSGGVTAAYSRTNFPSKTAAGHAALWTGTYGDFNGISGNQVLKLPLNDHAITEVADGFDSRELLAEPIWVTTARAGRRSLVLQATHVAPLSTYGEGGRFGSPSAGSMTLMDGYSGVLCDETVFDEKSARWAPASGFEHLPPSNLPHLESRIEVGAFSWFAVAFDDPQKSTGEQPGYDTVAIYSSKASEPVARLNPGLVPSSWSAPVVVPCAKGVGKAYFKLFDLSATADHWLLYMTPATSVANNKSEAAEAYYGNLPFIPQGAVRMWASGKLGKTLFQGGDGKAESRYLDTVEFLINRCVDRAAILRKRKDWDLAVTYLPFPDEALHAWCGAVDSRSPSYDRKLAPTVWHLLDRVGKACDNYIGALSGDPDTVVCVASDHGMAGLKWKFNPNVVLRHAGLLAVTRDGKIDLSRTKVYYPPTDSAFLVVNTVSHKGGIVPINQVGEVLAQAEEVLRLAKGDDHLPIVTNFIYPGRNDRLAAINLPDGRKMYDDLDLGGIRGGDLYLDLAPGYYFSSEYSTDKEVTPVEPGQGGHIFDPRRPEMHAALTMSGPGVKRGVQIGPVRNIDLAPTVTHLLGLPLPKRATGRVLEEALTEP